MQIDDIFRLAREWRQLWLERMSRIKNHGNRSTRPMAAQQCAQGEAPQAHGALLQEMPPRIILQGGRSPRIVLRLPYCIFSAHNQFLVITSSRFKRALQTTTRDALSASWVVLA